MCPNCLNVVVFVKSLLQVHKMEHAYIEVSINRISAALLFKTLHLNEIFLCQIENLQEQLRDKDKQLGNLKDRVKSLQTDSSNTDTALATLEEALSEKVCPQAMHHRLELGSWLRILLMHVCSSAGCFLG